MTIDETVAMKQRIQGVETTWKRTLEGIPSMLGRLAYMASLRTGEGGRYQHYGIAERLGEDATHALLSESHNRTFREWLALGLAEQKQDTHDYLFENGNALTGAPPEGAHALASWTALEAWSLWVPASSREVERELYRTDMGIVLELLRREVGVARRDPDL